MYDYMNYMYIKIYIVYRTIGFNKYISEFWVLSEAQFILAYYMLILNHLGYLSQSW